ncbi:hypothetical protein KM043_008006 [Ampulex compressa]|nr:hypothetical protein KM043_008006 [Ampulex compressa]
MYSHPSWSYGDVAVLPAKIHDVHIMLTITEWCAKKKATTTKNSVLRNEVVRRKEFSQEEYCNGDIR